MQNVTDLAEVIVTAGYIGIPALALATVAIAIAGTRTHIRTTATALEHHAAIVAADQKAEVA